MEAIERDNDDIYNETHGNDEIQAHHSEDQMGKLGIVYTEKFQRKFCQPKTSIYMDRVISRKRGAEITPKVAEVLDLENNLCTMYMKSNRTDIEAPTKRVRLDKSKESDELKQTATLGTAVSSSYPWWARELGLDRYTIAYLNRSKDFYLANRTWPNKRLVPVDQPYDSAQAEPSLAMQVPLHYQPRIKSGSVQYESSVTYFNPKVYVDNWRPVPSCVTSLVRRELQRAYPEVDCDVDNIKIRKVENAFSRHVEGLIDTTLAMVFESFEKSEELNTEQEECADDSSSANPVGPGEASTTCTSFFREKISKKGRFDVLSSSVCPSMFYSKKLEEKREEHGTVSGYGNIGDRDFVEPQKQPTFSWDNILSMIQSHGDVLQQQNRTALHVNNSLPDIFLSPTVIQRTQNRLLALFTNSAKKNQKRSRHKILKGQDISEFDP